MELPIPEDEYVPLIQNVVYTTPKNVEVDNINVTFVNIIVFARAKIPHKRDVLNKIQDREYVMRFITNSSYNMSDVQLANKQEGSIDIFFRYKILRDFFSNQGYVANLEECFPDYVLSDEVPEEYHLIMMNGLMPYSRLREGEKDVNWYMDELTKDRLIDGTNLKNPGMAWIIELRLDEGNLPEKGSNKINS